MTSVLVVLGCVAFVVVLALACWPRRPPPVVGAILPFHDPKKRKRFESKRSA